MSIPLRVPAAGSPATGNVWVETQPCGPADEWIWVAEVAGVGENGLGVWARNAGSTASYEQTDTEVFCVSR